MMEEHTIKPVSAHESGLDSAWAEFFAGSIAGGIMFPVEGLKKRLQTGQSAITLLKKGHWLLKIRYLYMGLSGKPWLESMHNTPKIRI